MKSSLTLLLIILTNLGFSQNPYYTSIDKTSGLPSNSVYDVYQDSQGFMWFATGKGLCRYDGNNFKTLTSDEQTSKSGSCIKEDSFSRIWYANFDGYLYYVEKGSLKALNQRTSLGYFRFGIIKDELFLIQPNAVFIYDLKSLKIKKKIEISDKFINSCFQANDKFYVIGDYLYEFSSSLSFSKYSLPIDFQTTINGPIMSHWNTALIFNSKSNKAIYTFKNGVFEKKPVQAKTEFIQNTTVIDNDLWICTPNGLLKNNLNNNKYETYFKEQNVSFIYQDKHKNYWISTLNNGLLFVENFENIILKLNQNPISLAQGKNEIYIGTEKELIYKLNCFDLSLKKIYETENNHSINQIYYDPTYENIFFNSYKFKILDKNNILTDEFQIAIKDIKKVDDKYFSFAASGINGLFYIDANKKSSWDFIFNKNLKRTFSGFNQSLLINKINGKSTEYCQDNNTIYYATNNGLFAVTSDGKNKEIKFKNETLYLIKIQKLKNKIIGLSTNEKLYEINQKNEISLFNLPDILKQEKINKFTIIDDFCYLFTSIGVFEYDLNTQKTIKVLASNASFEATDVVLNQNRLFFASSVGIIVKNRNDISNYPKPKLIINEINVNGINKEINELENLKTNENDITIHFSTLSFIPNENYSVSYKINDSKWKILDINAKNLKFSSLAAGKYTIAIAINHNNEKIELQKISLKIEKPFWLTTVFLILVCICILLLFYTFYRFQMSKVEKQNRILLEKNELEKNLNLSTLKAIKSQMNPHFFYNALNTIQSFILANDKKQAVTYLSKFSSLTRNILEMTEKEFVSISEEISTLSLYLDIEKARFDEDFEYEIKTFNLDDLDHIKIPAMLLQPYVENAVKHGLLHKSGLKKVTLSLEKLNNSIQIEIDDNGIGRTKSAELNAIKNKKHNSFATNAMQNRIDLLNKNKKHKISINYIDKLNQSEQSTGTTVVIEIPIN